MKKINFKTIDDLLNIEEAELLEFINQPLKPELTKDEENYLIYIRDFIKENINYIHRFNKTIEQRIRKYMISKQLIMFCYWKRKYYLKPKRIILLEEAKSDIIKSFNSIKNIEEGH